MIYQTTLGMGRGVGRTELGGGGGSRGGGGSNHCRLPLFCGGGGGPGNLETPLATPLGMGVVFN